MRAETAARLGDSLHDRELRKAGRWPGHTVRANEALVEHAISIQEHRRPTAQVADSHFPGF